MQGKSPKQYSDSAKTFGYAIIAIICIMIFATMLPAPQNTDPRPNGPSYNYWVPTEEDIQQLDSLHNIVKETNTDLDTVRQSLDRCLDKLDELHDAREWHGREGESEYGEYEYNKWMEKQ
jgi:hypothetical protein